MITWAPCHLAVAAVLILSTGGGSAVGKDTGQEVRTDFEAMTTGAAPPGFTFGLTGSGAPVRWTVLDDPKAPAGSKVLAETSADSTSNRFPLAVLDGFQANNVEISVQFKPVSGTVDQAAGLMARVRDADNYYIARANALEENVRLYRVVGGRRQQLASADAALPAGKWQTLGLRLEDSSLTVSLDGQELFTAVDDTFQGAGRVGLWTKADSLTYFDDLAVRELL